MKKYPINMFRGAGKTTNAVNMALAFMACGKNVDIVVGYPNMIPFIKDKLKKHDVSCVKISAVNEYKHGPATDVVICDECTYDLARERDNPNLLVIEYNTPKEWERLLHNEPNFMRIYTGLVLGCTLEKSDFMSVEETTKKEPTIVDKVADIKLRLDCTVEQALAIIAMERGI